MTKYRVTIIAKMLETYEVEAEDAEGAEDNWQDGKLVSTDHSLECEIISVEESDDSGEAKEEATGRRA